MASITVRVDEDTKEQAARILEGLGLDLSSATRAFFRQVVLKRGLPFDVAYPVESLTPEAEARFVQAEERLAAPSGGYSTPEGFFNALGI